ncbi:hypothetical protein GCM10027184_53320 [Saccharothrix stipae]
MDQDYPEKDDEPEGARKPDRSWRSDQASVLLGTLVQVVALIGQIIDLFK